MAFNFKLPVIILDCEMTGLNPDRHQLIQVSAWWCDPKSLKLVKKFNKFVGPEVSIEDLESRANPTSINFSSYMDNRDRIRLSQPPKECIQSLMSWLPEKYILVGYNLDLDIKFIGQVLESLSGAAGNAPRLSFRKIDLAHLVEFYLSKYGTSADIVSRKLADVCTVFGLPPLDSHDSDNDCNMCLNLLKHFINIIEFKET